MTSITFPPAFIEGTETVVMFFIFLLFPDYIEYLFFIFGLGVSFNVV